MKSRRRFRIVLFLFVCLFVFTLTGCGGCGGGAKYKTRYAERFASTDELTKTTIDNQVEWIKNEIVVKKDEIYADTEKSDAEKYQELIEYTKSVIADYPNYEGITGKEEAKWESNYKYQLIKADVTSYSNKLDELAQETDIEKINAIIADVDVQDIKDALPKTASCLSACFAASTNVKANEIVKTIEEETNLQRIAGIFTIQVDIRDAEMEPIRFYASSFGDFMGHLFDNLLIFPVGWLLYALSKLFGGYYILGLFFATIIVRTIGWPIYAKTNDMSVKMQAIQPEIQKIQNKYANRKDPDSQRMMQMEQARLYKQNKIGLGGCLMPILQFPIFMAVFRAISRLPYTVATEGTIFTRNWASELKPNFLGLNLFEDRTAGTGQMIWIIVLVLLVVATQFISQRISEIRQKKSQEKAQEDIPAYRRQAAAQAKNDTQKTMKIVMYMMMLMMGVFVWTSKAGLGLYWLIGNLYSMAQTAINSRQSAKKLARIREQQKYK